MATNKSEVIAEQIAEVKDADSLGETKFSKLFHEARTSTPDNHRTNGYSSVTVQVRIQDGEFQVHSKPVKTRQGERLRGTDSWDAKVSLTVKPFMEARIARNEIIRQLRAFQRNHSQKAQ